ncbi:MAG: CoA transferase [Rhodospirillales bacterium]|nr:CoA transferase [Rhodospirillales bacterium]
MMPTETMLSGLQVVEVAQGVAGPMCGKVFADLGAEVTRVEPPGGDWLLKVAADGGARALYDQLNAGKRKLSLDLAAPAGRASLAALVSSADVLVVGEREAKLTKLGLDAASLCHGAPRVVYCHVSGWGSGGPMGDKAASELAIQVVTGMTRYLGTLGEPPVRQGIDLVAVDTGIAAAQAALAALLWRETSGTGQRVEVSMLATAIALMQWDTTAFSGPEAWEGRQLTADQWSEDHGFQLADARCLIDLRSRESGWSDLLRELGCPDLADDPRLQTEHGLDLTIPDLPRLTAGRLTQWTFAEVEPMVRDKYQGTIVPMLDYRQVLEHPQIRHLGLVTPGAVPRVRFPMDMKS